MLHTLPENFPFVPFIEDKNKLSDYRRNSWKTAMGTHIWNSYLICSFSLLYLAASGGQSGWFDGCAARNAGWLSSSLSMRKMMGYGRRSTWNLWIEIDRLLVNLMILNQNRLQYLPPSIEYLWHQAAVCHWYFVANTIFPSRCGQQLFNRTKTTGDPMLCPFLFLLFTDMNQHNQVLQWLNAGRDHFAYFAYFASFVNILWQQRSLWARLFQIVHNSYRLDQSVTICIDWKQNDDRTMEFIAIKIVILAYRFVTPALVPWDSLHGIHCNAALRPIWSNWLA